MFNVADAYGAANLFIYTSVLTAKFCMYTMLLSNKVKQFGSSQRTKLEMSHEDTEFVESKVKTEANKL